MNVPLACPIYKLISVCNDTATSSQLLYSEISINSWILIRHNKRLFKTLAQYLDITEILNAAKVKGLEKYKKLLKNYLKNVLYAGISTKDRIDYWFTIGMIRKNLKKYAKLYNYLQGKKSGCEAAIGRDIVRTYPSLYFFEVGELGHTQLSRILKAISLLFPDIGYCQGMNFFSALILLILNNEEVNNK